MQVTIENYHLVLLQVTKNWKETELVWQFNFKHF